MKLDLAKQFGISTDDLKVDFYIPDEAIECMPCEKGRCDGIPLRKCMEAITPNTVENILKGRLLDA